MIEAIFVLSVIVWLACQRQQGHLVQRRPSYIIRETIIETKQGYAMKREIIYQDSNQ